MKADYCSLQRIAPIHLSLGPGRPRLLTYRDQLPLKLLGNPELEEPSHHHL